MAATKDIPLTNEEIWDDSALVDSWNSALEEYKKYHSIHTKGGNVADLLKSKKPEPVPNSGEIPLNASAEQHNNTQDGESASILPHNTEPQGENLNGISGSGAPTLAPEIVLGSVRDEGLKKLLMSWYYAGYYTGLYEGQRGQAGQQQG